MFDGIDTAALRICPVSPYNSAFGKAADKRYTASTKSIPLCHTCNSRKWLTYAIDHQSPIPSPYPACSDTFISMPSEASVLSNELPPELISGKGIPLVGIMPSTTLILISPCTTTTAVTPKAR